MLNSERQQLQMDQPQTEPPLPTEGKYFKLIEAVGSKGRYQTAIVILSCILCFQNGFVSLGTPYYFANAPYTNCPQQYEGITKCTQFACSLPANQRKQYEQPQIQELSTLGSEFGDYHCSASDTLEAAKGIYYLGGIIGMLISSSVADNLGRRPTLLVSLAVGVLGHVIVQLAGGLGLVQVGMFLIGMSVESCYNICFCFLSEVLENEERQVKLTLIQGFFCLAGIVVVVTFYIMKAWRGIFIVICLIPLSVSLVFSYYFVQETPQFLIKRYTVKEIRSSFRFIAKINGTIQGFDQIQILSEASLQSLKSEYNAQIQKSQKKAFTYFDLFRYPSLRKITIFMLLLFCTIDILYYAPVMLIDQFGFDFYLNGIIVNLSQLVTYFVSYFTITKIKRKKFNVAGSAIVILASFVLVFLHTKQICTENCWNAKNILELLLIFIMRFFVSFVLQVLFVYITELYPIQVVGLAIGFNGVAGSIPVMFLPEVINLIDRSNFPVMELFCIIAGMSLFFSLFLAETYGRPPAEKIKEIQNGQTLQGGATPKDIELVQEENENP